jgi:16S rRNA (guanine966-N2)-methyltransferase
MGQVRIIGGAWKRTPISVSDREGLRPTPDRVRETLFNWLGQNLQGWRCLDLFAGSGALGFEAGSRGAKQVVFVEPDAKAATAIAQLIEKLNSRDRLVLVRGKAQDYLARAAVDCHGPSALAMTNPFDLIFLDPPFGKGLAEALMPQVLPLLAPQAYVYLESDKPVDPQQAGLWGLDLVRQDKAGAVHYHLLQKREVAQGDANAESRLSGDI